MTAAKVWLYDGRVQPSRIGRTRLAEEGAVDPAVGAEAVRVSTAGAVHLQALPGEARHPRVDPVCGAVDRGPQRTLQLGLPRVRDRDHETLLAGVGVAVLGVPVRLVEL
jgi:hypothetical protein